MAAANGTTPKVLCIVGVAGFIGSHFALMLIDRGNYNVTAVDDLSRGSIDTILRLQAIAAEKGQPFQFVRMDVARQDEMEALLRRNQIEAVVHFSGNAYVGESMAHPEDYYQNITVSTVALQRAMQLAGVSKLIFSSSCATFGNPTEFPITERTPQRPTNPYGNAKLQAQPLLLTPRPHLRLPRSTATAAIASLACTTIGALTSLATTLPSPPPSACGRRSTRSRTSSRRRSAQASPSRPRCSATSMSSAPTPRAASGRTCATRPTASTPASSTRRTTWPWAAASSSRCSGRPSPPRTAPRSVTTSTSRSAAGLASPAPAPGPLRTPFRSDPPLS